MRPPSAALFVTLQQSWQRLDVLFNNAGGNVPATNFGDMTDEQWDGVVAGQSQRCVPRRRGAFRMMRDQTPQGGRIINNGSISAHAPPPRLGRLYRDKHGITGLTKSISLDGRKFNIACGQIDVGNAATPMTRRMACGVPQANGTMAPEPTMDVENVARSVVLMANMPADGQRVQA